MVRDLLMVWELSRCLFPKDALPLYVQSLIPRISWNTANETIRDEGQVYTLIMSNEIFILLIANLFCNWEFHALYYQMWVQIWLGMLDGWNTKIKVYAACFLFWRIFKSWSTFPPIVNLTSFNGAQWGMETRRLKNATDCDSHRIIARGLA